MLPRSISIVVVATAFSCLASPASAQFNFAAPATYGVPNAPQSITSADLNRDGLPDVVVGAEQSIQVLLNNGDGTLAAPASVPTFGLGVRRVVLGDFDNDGIPDLAFGNLGTAVYVLLGRGDGTFKSFTEFGTRQDNWFAVALAAADFDRSGGVDLALINVGLFGQNPTLSIFTNQGNGTFTHTLTAAAPGANLAVADLNNDNAQDLIVAGGTTLSVSMNLGTGQFAPFVSYSTGEIHGVVAGKLDSDEFIDLSFFGINGASVGVLLNRGDGSFVGPSFYPSGLFPVGEGLGDIDGDARTDVAVNSSGALRILRGTGGGTFAAPVEVGTIPRRMDPLLLID
jgi:hypothetical protein